ncbi:MAG: bacterial ammonia monooxygenase, subunit AmoB [Candidatus Entotheonellia bacterium]
MGQFYRSAAGVAVVLGVLVAWAPRTGAHGEAAQDAFIRTRTVAFYDVQFSGTEIRSGETMAITGKFFMLKEWPTGVDKPDLMFLTAASPGPVMLVQERWINGVFTPGSVALRQGEEYEFKLVLRGRREGRYHVHPMVAVQGVGPLLGPGAWIAIAGGGSFENPLTLWNGETIDLETFTLSRIAIWHVIVVALGLAWLMYWIAQPILRRSRWVASGAGERLITRRDRRVSIVLGVLTGTAIVVGVLTTKASYPHTIPHQVIKVEIPTGPQPASFVKSKREAVRYDPVARTLTLEVEVTNTDEKPAILRQFVTSMLTFMNKDLVPQGEHLLVLDPPGPVNPGETKLLRLLMTDQIWEQQRLVDLSQPQLRFGGVLIFESSAGGRSVTAIDAPLHPYFGSAS